MVERLRSASRTAAELVLRPYAQIVFSRNLGTGFLVVGAIATYPRILVLTLLAVVTAHGVALVFGLGMRALREGTHACTAVLTTLALAVFRPSGGDPLLLTLLSAGLSVFVMASFDAVFSGVELPAHSLPFIATTWITHLAARSLPASPQWTSPFEQLPLDAWLGGIAGFHWLRDATWLDVPATLVFLSGPVAGLLMIAAIAVHSRIALLLAGLGAVVTFVLRLVLRSQTLWSETDVIASFNGLLAAMAIGGVWFVPQLASLLLASVAAGIAAWLSYALVAASALAFLPALSLPFAATTHLLLAATRKREANLHPRSTIPAGSPEEALSRQLIFVRRFGNTAWLPFRLPFRGEWVVTQGYDGPHTHRGPWRHGLDFEVLGEDGQVYDRSGDSLTDYHCYDLPVISAGVGIVVRIIDGIDDNPPGGLNTRENWGNAVVIRHGPLLHSVYAHLKPGSIAVREGEFVKDGREIARCGNSGRSLVPHLHFQLQRTEPLGSPTIPGDFGDVVQHADGGYTLDSRVVPRQGDRVRPILHDRAIARALAFPPGAEFELHDETTGRRERARAEVDLRGRRLVRSSRAELHVDPYDGGFVIVDFAGEPASLLRDVLIALARVPFDQAPELSWMESVPRRLLLPAWLRSLGDIAAVFAPEAGGVSIRYQAKRSATHLVVVGSGRHGTTRAEVSLQGEVHRLSIDHENRRRRVTLTQLPPQGANPDGQDDGALHGDAPSARIPAPGKEARRPAQIRSLAAGLLTGILFFAPKASSSDDRATFDLRAGAWDRSVVLEREGKRKEALALLEHAYGTTPRGYEVTVRLAWLNLQLGYYKRAEALYRRARTLPGAGSEATDGLSSALVLQGYAALDVGDLSLARRAFREALSFQPDRADARRGIWLAREKRLDPEIWGGYLGEGVGDLEANGWIAFARLPYRASDHFEVRGAYRHSELILRTPSGMGSMAGAGRQTSRWSQDELYGGVGLGTRLVWLDLLGVLLWSTTEGFVPGEAVHLRAGRRLGVSLEQAALARSGGWNFQVSPLAFWWPERSLGLSAGLRVTSDALGSEYSARAGLQFSHRPFDLFFNGHLGTERWPLIWQIPMTITVEQDLTMGASLTAVLALGRRFSLGLSGQLEQLDDAGTTGIYGNVATGLCWSADLSPP